MGRATTAALLVVSLLAGCVSVASAQPAGARSQAPGPASPSPELPLCRVDLEPIRVDLRALTTLARDIHSATKQETFFTKIRDTFISNFLWEIFGFKHTEKTVVGMLLSVLGILGLGLRLILLLARRGKPEPRWLRVVMAMYLVLAVTAFTALTFSGGIAADVHSPEAATKVLAERVAALGSTVDRRLHGIEDRLGAVSQRLSTPPVAPPPGGPSPGPGGEAGLGESARTSLSRIEALANGAASFAREAAGQATAAAKKAGEAAARSTGWGWHLLTTLLLALVLAAQVLILRERL